VLRSGHLHRYNFAQDEVSESAILETEFAAYLGQLYCLACATRGIELKWFGGKQPQGFTSRYDSWRYIRSKQYLPNTLSILATTFDLRIPLTFSVEDMLVIGEIIDEVVGEFVS
jgi:hypothetical protein